MAGFGMNRHELRLLLEQDPRDVEGQIVGHRAIDDEDVGDADDGHRLSHAAVGVGGNLERKVEIAELARAAPAADRRSEAAAASMPGLCARSWTAAVGRPPLKKNAATLPSFNAPADSDAPSPWRVTSRSGSSPAALSTRKAMTSVPLPGDPVDTVLPRRSATLAMPVDAVVTMCV